MTITRSRPKESSRGFSSLLPIGMTFTSFTKPVGIVDISVLLTCCDLIGPTSRPRAARPGEGGHAFPFLQPVVPLQPGFNGRSKAGLCALDDSRWQANFGACREPLLRSSFRQLKDCRRQLA